MTNQWDQYADMFNEGIGESGDALHANLINPLLDEFLGDISGKSILDVGCGNGYLLRRLAPKAGSLTGLDASTKLLQIAKANTKNLPGIDLVAGDLSAALPFLDQSFDTVIANMVLQYVPELTSFARESARILKSKGQLIIVVHHPAGELFLRAQQLVGKKSEKYLSLGSYFTSEKRTKKSLWDKAILEYYHRPLMEYLNPFVRYFHLDQLTEKTEDGETPRILGLKWEKR